MMLSTQKQLTASFWECITHVIKNKYFPIPTALETATHAETLLENKLLFNSGHGAVFTRDGINELEASVMVLRGFKKRGVGVAGVRHVRDPVLLAKALLEHGEKDLGGGSVSGRPSLSSVVVACRSCSASYCSP
ncbi:isoaspartyl peptidase/L-asparaginase [Colletotrichum truncatum]|uniref:Isoaspartyl peptidase/L-asparaginase n=1 Tax=Colletotrichum truncatum TaxID=5467 RepID=A0ACC3ZKL5_COLTU|nr:isoaspartyl peptidase/L-asparaginase [Colletotrichum truncatum]KAF6800057.1 isoaspartyl peptidase/L-asparaginase [Colletotrichum truncatum]